MKSACSTNYSNDEDADSNSYTTTDEGEDEKEEEEEITEEEITEEEFIDDITQGMIYAALAVTDDKRKTLKRVGKANPWHVEALTMITGSSEQAHKPLTNILQEDCGLKLDAMIDVSGITKGGHFLDTQGYIAHNSESIVLSYRCTTSAFDWLTNLNATTSAWEIEEDLEQGFSGYCSGLEGLCCNSGEYKPRVHTGFYNNFLASLPLIKEHIEPLLRPDQPPRKLYVVGHSLGAGIATLAGCYFLLEHDWRHLPHTLVNVTAGSPRACCQSMKTVIEKRRLAMGTSKARMYRMVNKRDVVTSVPPKSFGFQHLVEPVKINKDGAITIWAQEDADAPTAQELGKLLRGLELSKEVEYEKDLESNYQRVVARIPGPFRDHMPDFYLKPLFAARGVRNGTIHELKFQVEKHVLVTRLRAELSEKIHQQQKQLSDQKQEKLKQLTDDKEQKLKQKELLRVIDTGASTEQQQRSKLQTKWRPNFGRKWNNKVQSANNPAVPSATEVRW
jgi:hypothetical protein